MTEIDPWRDKEQTLELALDRFDREFGMWVHEMAKDTESQVCASRISA